GQIKSSYNDNLAKAVAAFQSVNGLSAAGSVDAATWTALNNNQSSEHPEQAQPDSAFAGQQGAPKSLSAKNKAHQQQRQPPSYGLQTSRNTPPAVVAYIVTLEDISGPFTKIPRISGRNAGERRMVREAKLHRLNFQGPLDLLAEKFHSSLHLLVQLNP